MDAERNQREGLRCVRDTVQCLIDCLCTFLYSIWKIYSVRLCYLWRLQYKVLYWKALITGQTHMLLAQVRHTEIPKAHWLVFSGPVDITLSILTLTQRWKQVGGCVFICSHFISTIWSICVFVFVWELYLTVCVWQTNNSVCVVFPDHSPEISHRAAQRSLAHYKLLTVVMSLRKHEQHQPYGNYFADVLKITKVPRHGKKYTIANCLTMT